MEIKDLTPEIVTPILTQLVEEFGEDYVYKADERDIGGGPACRYREDGKPSCIVGHVLDRAGVEYDPEWDNDGLVYCHIADPHTDKPVHDGLDTAQTLQDSGDTWGTALNAYLAIVNAKESK